LAHSSPGSRAFTSAMAVVRSLIVSGFLALQASVLAEGSSLSGGQPPLEQKWDWSWSDLADLKQQVKDGMKEQTEQLTESIDDYKQSAKDYAEALKDSTFKQALKSAGICQFAKKAEVESAPVIEQEIPEPLAKTEQDPVETPEACEAVADKVTAEEIKSQLKSGETGEVVDKFMKLVVQQSSGALCEGENGIKGWLQENAGLKESDPDQYKQELKKQLKGKVGPILGDYTSKLCPAEEERLFELGSGPLAVLKGKARGAGGLLALLSVAMFGLGALALRRRACRARREELQRLAPGDGDIEGILE